MAMESLFITQSANLCTGAQVLFEAGDVARCGPSLAAEAGNKHANISRSEKPNKGSPSRSLGRIVAGLC